MSELDQRVDARTGLPLVRAERIAVKRIARVTRGPLDPPDRLPVHAAVVSGGRVEPYPRSKWSRFDVSGRTLYFGDSALAAYGEALGPYKRIGALDADLTFMGVDQLDDLPDEDDWQEWRAERRLWSATLPDGEFIDVLDGRTIAYLEHATVVDELGNFPPLSGAMFRAGIGRNGLTTAHLLSDDRALTTAVADVLYDALLDGDTHPLGVTWESKRGWGRNYALWLRDEHTVDGVRLSKPTVILPSDEDLRTIAKAYRLPIA